MSPCFVRVGSMVGDGIAVGMLDTLLPVVVPHAVSSTISPKINALKMNADVFF